MLATTSLCLLATICGLARAPEPAAKPAENAYVFENCSPGVLGRWQSVGRTTLALGADKHGGDPYFCLDATFHISKAGQLVDGLVRHGLGLPLPVAVRFWVRAESPYLWVELGDKGGRRASSRVPLAIDPQKWCQVEIPLAKTVPLGLGAKPLRDLDMVALLTQESAGENYATKPFLYQFAHFEAVYAAGQGPTNPVLTRADVEATLQPLDAAIPRLEGLIKQARAGGIETRYATVALTVVKRYRHEALEMMQPDDPWVAERAAKATVEIATRAEANLRAALAHRLTIPRVPQVSLRNLRVREGSFFSGNRPVMLAGVCGWFAPSYFDQLSGMGYTVLSVEAGPAVTLPAKGVRRPEALNGLLAVMDAAAKHNMACDLLLSPHYIPAWAWKAYPDLDPTGWRRETNGFMPWAVTSPHLRDILASHLAVTIPRVRNNPALLSYDLANEAWYRTIPDFPAAELAKFRDAHPGINEFQAVADVESKNVTDWVRWYVDEVHKFDSTHPIQMKTNSTQEVVNVNREAVGDILTANGMDVMPSYPDMSGRLAADFTWPLLRMDFHRSLTPDKPIEDGEYHICGGTFATPPAYARAALWDLALHGRDMTAVWVYDRVDPVSIYYHPAAVEILGDTALDFLRLGPEIQAFQRAHSPLAIYYGGTEVEKAYQACLFQDLDVGVLTDKRILAGRLGWYKAVVLPAGAQLSPEVVRRLVMFERAGGRVVRCQRHAKAEDLWFVVHTAIAAAHLTRLVDVGRWGVECRSVKIGARKLCYILNHTTRAVELRPHSAWKLTGAKELRTGRTIDAGRLRLQPLEIVIFEAK